MEASIGGADEGYDSQLEHDVSKEGKLGEKIILTTNYFLSVTKTNWCLYKYTLNFSPEKDRTTITVKHIM